MLRRKGSSYKTITGRLILNPQAKGDEDFDEDEDDEGDDEIQWLDSREMEGLARGASLIKASGLPTKNVSVKPHGTDRKVTVQGRFPLCGPWWEAEIKVSKTKGPFRFMVKLPFYKLCQDSDVSTVSLFLTQGCDIDNINVKTFIDTMYQNGIKLNFRNLEDALDQYGGLKEEYQESAQEIKNRIHKTDTMPGIQFATLVLCSLSAVHGAIRSADEGQRQKSEFSCRLALHGDNSYEELVPIQTHVAHVPEMEGDKGYKHKKLINYAKDETVDKQLRHRDKIEDDDKGVGDRKSPIVDEMEWDEVLISPSDSVEKEDLKSKTAKIQSHPDNRKLQSDDGPQQSVIEEDRYMNKADCEKVQQHEKIWKRSEEIFDIRTHIVDKLKEMAKNKLQEHASSQSGKEAEGHGRAHGESHSFELEGVINNEKDGG